MGMQAYLVVMRPHTEYRPGIIITVWQILIFKTINNCMAIVSTIFSVLSLFETHVHIDKYIPEDSYDSLNSTNLLSETSTGVSLWQKIQD